VDDERVLATRLLRSSLLSSLGRVLGNSRSGITLDAALKMGELPEGSAVIAGSTIVAACLGKDWSNWPRADVDVYCSAMAAPQVRSVRLLAAWGIHTLLVRILSPLSICPEILSL
jgi:hypothetical protein